MKRIRLMATILACGLVIGSVASIYTAPSASAGAYFCSNKIEKMEKDAAHDLAKGKITQDEYDKLMQEVAFHQELWGC
jgi:hypothetical protein